MAALPADDTFTAAGAGRHTFSVTSRTAGTRSITVTDTANANIAGGATSTVSAAATASFVGADAATQGSWIGTYGAQGYDILSGGGGLPGHATVAMSGQSYYTWTSSTTDARALENPAATGRSATCWLSYSSFTIDVKLGDGLAHDLALYALDWDRAGRSEQIQVISAATGAVLDTETVSSFSGGEYLQWSVSGHVVIKVTNLGPGNAVLSGLFLDHALSPRRAVTRRGRHDRRQMGRIVRSPRNGASGRSALRAPQGNSTRGRTRGGPSGPSSG
jgi:hypothetical protein